jgi:hypothetical protein
LQVAPAVAHPEPGTIVADEELGGTEVDLEAEVVVLDKEVEEEVVVLGKEVKAVMLEKEAKLEVESELEVVMLGKDM